MRDGDRKERRGVKEKRGRNRGGKEKKEKRGGKRMREKRGKERDRQKDKEGE